MTTAAMTNSEMQAEVVGSTKKLLKQRLIEAKNVLAKQYRPHFVNFTFDADNKRLVSGDGKYALQWQMRERPEEEISYKNQQTSRGCVLLFKLK